MTDDPNHELPEETIDPNEPPDEEPESEPFDASSRYRIVLAKSLVALGKPVFVMNGDNLEIHLAVPATHHITSLNQKFPSTGMPDLTVHTLKEDRLHK